MQSLLADRFHLRAHFERRTERLLALVPVKPGKLGSRLRPHAEGLSCDAKWTAPPDRSSPSVPPGGFMPVCGDVGRIPGRNQTVILGGRNIPFEHLADYLPALEDFGRPVVDQTGMSGTYDFSLNWMPERDGPLERHGRSTSSANVQLDAGGPTLLEALKEQLGLKLKSTKAPVRILVIDHVEHPSPN